MSASPWNPVQPPRKTSCSTSNLSTPPHPSGEFFRHLFETSPEPVLVNDGGIVSLCNAAAARLFGAETAAAIVGRSPFELFHPDFHGIVARRIATLLRGEAVPFVEEKIVRLDGEILPVEVAAAPVRTDRGTVIQLVLRDATERKRADGELRVAKAGLEAKVAERTANMERTVARLREEMEQRREIEEVFRKGEALLRTVLEALPVAVCLTDGNGRLAFYNRAAWTLWGGDLPPETQFHGWRLETGESIPPEEWAGSRALRGETVTGEMAVIETFDGVRKTVLNSAVPMIDGRGAISGVVTVTEEITKQQEMQQQFLHAQKQDLIGSLAGGIAHDFNNILTAVCGYTEYALDLADGDDIRDALSQVLEAGGRASELTRKLLAFSRQQVTEMRPVSLTRIVENSIRFLARVIPENIRLVQKLSRNRLNILGDAAQMEQVITNIVVNARDAMPDGGTIRVRSGEEHFSESDALSRGLKREGHYAVVELADWGPGIERKHLDRIFDPFYTTKPTGKGTGLGLAIAYGVMQQHGGTINVSSAVGEGTVFTLFVPMVGERVRKPATERSAIPPGGTEHVLIVEDDPVVKEYFRRTLEAAGYRVTTAEDGKRALALLRQIPRVDAVVSDVIMPKMNGMEMVRLMRRKMPELKVVFASGYSAEIVTREGVLDAGAAFVRKPVSRETLLRNLREVLDGG